KPIRRARLRLRRKGTGGPGGRPCFPFFSATRFRAVSSREFRMTHTLSLSRRGILGGFVSTLALAACNPVTYTAPKADVATSFASSSPARRAGSNAWWAAFRDKRLDALIAAGLKRNLDVQTAVATIREAQANARLVGANDLPQ